MGAKGAGLLPAVPAARTAARAADAHGQDGNDGRDAIAIASKEQRACGRFALPRVTYRAHALASV